MYVVCGCGPWVGIFLAPWDSSIGYLDLDMGRLTWPLETAGWLERDVGCGSCKDKRAHACQGVSIPTLGTFGVCSQSDGETTPLKKLLVILCDGSCFGRDSSNRVSRLSPIYISRPVVLSAHRGVLFRPYPCVHAIDGSKPISAHDTFVHFIHLPPPSAFRPRLHPPSTSSASGNGDPHSLQQGRGVDTTFHQQ
jgi:hypothetical protein